MVKTHKRLKKKKKIVGAGGLGGGGGGGGENAHLKLMEQNETCKFSAYIPYSSWQLTDGYMHHMVQSQDN